MARRLQQYVLALPVSQVSPADPLAQVHDGVTLDLSLLNRITYDSKTKLASIGAGACWVDVYKKLNTFGVTVAGGRTATVGVAGFLTSGGNNFYSNAVGLGCDNVINFEVVLANGDIVNANADTHTDLCRALRGGSLNFGIVTRFDMQTIGSTKLWGGQVTFPVSATEQLITAYIDYIDLIPSYPTTHAMVAWSYDPTIDQVVAAAALYDTTATTNHPAFDSFLAINPKLHQRFRTDTHLGFAHSLEEPRGYRQIWTTLTAKKSASFMRRAIAAQAAFIKAWKTSNPDDVDFINTCDFQAIPIAISHNPSSNNVLGLDRLDQDAILFQMQMMVRSPAQETDARARITLLRLDLKAYTCQEGIDVDWEYLGYADCTQDPLSTYGAENVELMRNVALKYDPEGMLQTCVPGGFKLFAKH